MSEGHLSRIDANECMELLGVRTVGFVAFVDHDGQQLVPVNYVVHGGDIVFRTSEGSFLATLADGRSDVAFAVAYTGEVEARGWNVTVRGSTRAIPMDQFEGRLPRTWAGGQRDLLIALTPEHVDGRRVLLR